MRDRRENARDKVIYGGVADIGENGASRECIVRNISEGADVVARRTEGPLLPRQGGVVAR